jgi:hypothetical protein
MGKNKVEILPVIASIGIGAAVYSMMTGRAGQLQNMLPLTGLTNQGGSGQRSNKQG